MRSVCCGSSKRNGQFPCSVVDFDDVIVQIGPAQALHELTEYDGAKEPLDDHPSLFPALCVLPSIVDNSFLIFHGAMDVAGLQFEYFCRFYHSWSKKAAKESRLLMGCSGSYSRSVAVMEVIHAR